MTKKLENKLLELKKDGVECVNFSVYTSSSHISDSQIADGVMKHLNAMDKGGRNALTDMEF